MRWSTSSSRESVSRLWEKRTVFSPARAASPRMCSAICTFALSSATTTESAIPGAVRLHMAELAPLPRSLTPSRASAAAARAPASQCALNHGSEVPGAPSVTAAASEATPPPSTAIARAGSGGVGVEAPAAAAAAAAPSPSAAGSSSIGALSRSVAGWL